jgi:hypothetical protein
VTDTDLPPPSWVPTLPFDLRFRRMGGKLLLARQDRGAELEDVGAEIFGQIDEERSVAAIADAISADFDVDRETALADVREFLAELVDLGLLVRDW